MLLCAGSSQYNICPAVSVYLDSSRTAAGQQQQQQEAGAGRKEARRKESLTVTAEDIGAITDETENVECCYVQVALSTTFALRPLSTSTAAGQQQQQQEAGSGRKEERRKDSLTVTEEDIGAITDQIPQRPMGVVEGTSYTVVIVAALAFAGMNFPPCRCFVNGDLFQFCN